MEPRLKLKIFGVSLKFWMRTFFNLFLFTIFSLKTLQTLPGLGWIVTRYQIDHKEDIRSFAEQLNFMAPRSNLLWLVQKRFLDYATVIWEDKSNQKNFVDLDRKTILVTNSLYSPSKHFSRTFLIFLAILAFPSLYNKKIDKYFRSFWSLSHNFFSFKTS